MPSYSKRRLHFYLANDMLSFFYFLACARGVTQTHIRLFFLGGSQSIIMYTKIYIYF